MSMWSTEGLWLKAKLFIDKANAVDHASSDFPFWSVLSIEFLARAALTNIHPSLNADPREDVNLLYACGVEISGQPKSLPVHSVYIRLEKIIPRFGKLQREFCDYFSLLRNQELHTAELPFENIKASSWLPRCYEVCEILCESLNKTLNEYLGDEVATSALKLISTLAKETEHGVKSKVAAHRKVFAERGEEERKRLRSKAELALAVLEPGLTTHECPACKSEGMLKGELIKELKPVYEEEQLVVDQEYLASEFKCLACGLTLHSVEEIAHAGIEPTFSHRRATDLHELFQPEFDYEYDNM